MLLKMWTKVLLLWNYNRNFQVTLTGGKDNVFTLELKKGHFLQFEIDDESVNTLYKNLSELPYGNGVKFSISDSELELPGWSVQRLLVPFRIAMVKKLTALTPIDEEPEENVDPDR